MAHQCPGGRPEVWDRAARKPIEPPETPTVGLIEDRSLGAGGPLMVRGSIAVTGADRRAYELRNRQALCRCGASPNRPFCDGSHARVGYRDGINEDAHRPHASDCLDGLSHGVAAIADHV